MLANNHPNPLIRLNDLINAIKRVYASTFYQGAKDYIKITSYRSEEEKMAVIIQKMIGTRHGNRFYPDFSGVGKSHNFYPVPPQKSSDGIVAVALGLGKQVVDGGNAIKFCPKYPTDLIQAHSVEEALNNNQLDFYALDMEDKGAEKLEIYDKLVKKYPLTAAEEDGSLKYSGSTYSPENDVIHEGLSRKGMRVVTFSPVLRQRLFPLPQILELLLDMGTWGMGTPIEIEFAVDLNRDKELKASFYLLQIKPLIGSMQDFSFNPEELDSEKVLMLSEKGMGNGLIDDIDRCIAGGGR